MAIEKVVKISVDQVQAAGGLEQFTKGLKEADKATVNLRTELRKAQQEVAELSNKFGATSKEAIQAAKRAGELKDQMEDAKNLTAAFNPDAKFKALSASLSGVASGFAAYQGALGLAGSENKNLEKQLLKVQSAMALAGGLQALGEAKDSFKQLQAVAVDAFKGIRNAIGSTGIGLLVVALGAIYTYWDDIKEAVSGVSEEQKKLNKDSQTNLDQEIKKLDAISDQDNILKLQGKTEKQILEFKKQQTDEAISAAEINLKNIAITNEESQKAVKQNYAYLKSFLDFISIPQRFLYENGAKAINALISLINKIPGVDIQARVDENFGDTAADYLAKLVFDPDAVADEGKKTIEEQTKVLNNLKNQRAGYQNSINDINKKSEEDNSKAILEARREYLAKANEQQTEFEKLDEDRRKREADAEKLKVGEREKNLATEANALKASNELKQKLFEESAAYELNARQAFEDAKFNIASQGLSLLSQLTGRSKALATGILILEKSLAISQVVVSAARSIAQAQANLAATPAVIGVVPNPMYAVQAAATAKGIITTKIAAGISIASILAQTVGKLSGGNVGGGGSSGGSSGGGGNVTAPSFNIVGQNPNNQLAQSIAGRQSQPIEAYVVSGNVSNAQSLDRNRIATATFN